MMFPQHHAADQVEDYILQGALLLMLASSRPMMRVGGLVGGGYTDY